MKNSILSASILATSLTFSATAQAVVVASSTLNVAATVAVDCTVTTTPVSFGNLNATQRTLANGDVSVTCTTGTPYTITLDAGLNPDSSLGFRARYMKNAASIDTARYFLDVILGDPQWGDAGYANTFPAWGGVADTGNGLTQPHTVYGEAYGRNTLDLPASSGFYSDTVTVTVLY